MSGDSHASGVSPVFAPTRWTLILRARGETPEARTALGELCDAYYEPVLRFLRREGRHEDAARDLAQEFFARVLAGGAFDGADPERGRFRSYLLGALKHFLADHRKREHRIKRGGESVTESIEDLAAPADDTPGVELPDPAGPSPEALFDREWALAVMGRSLDRLRAEFVQEAKVAQFDALKPWLMGEAPSLSQAEAARVLGATEGAVKVMIHRLRKRFRDSIRTEIAQTLRDPSLVDEELRHLIEALA